MGVSRDTRTHARAHTHTHTHSHTHSHTQTHTISSIRLPLLVRKCDEKKSKEQGPENKDLHNKVGWQ